MVDANQKELNKPVKACVIGVMLSQEIRLI